MLLGLTSKGQPLTKGYSITNYNSDNALPQNSINSMAFDKNGFLWLATKWGILRFDGKNFREYNPENSAALLWNEYSLPQTEPGTDRLFFKPVFDTAHILTLTDDYQIVTDPVRSVMPHRQFVTSNNHLFFYNNIYRKYGIAYKQLFDKLVTSYAPITVNEQQAYFYDAGVCYFLDETTGSMKELREITGHKLKLQFITDGFYFFIDDQYRAYAYKNGILQSNITYAANLGLFFRRAAAVNPDPVQASLKTRRDGRHTLMLCNDTILQLRMVYNVLDYKILAADIPVKDIKCMIYDEGYQALYIGTITNGLYVLKLHEFERLFFNDTRFIANSQSLQIELPGSRILTPTGILNYSNTGHVLFPDTHSFGKQAWLQAADGSIWLSEFDSLKRTDIHLTSFETLKPLGHYLTGIIERDNKDIIYSNKHQVFRRHGTADTILLNESDLMQTEVQTLKEVSPNNLWIGTSAGLFTYDLSGSREGAGLRPVGGLEKAAIQTIYVAKDSSIWIGTYGQGIYKFYKDRFIKMPMDSRKSLVTAHCFMEDRQGYFWIPTNRGLFRVAKKELDNYAAGRQQQVYYYYVDKSYGFSTNEFNGRCTPCGIVTRDNFFSLPSLDGLVRFNPDSVHIILPDNPIFVDLLQANDKRLPVKNKLELTRDSNQLVFEISTPYFGNRFNLHLEYTIKGLNDNWYPVPDDGKLILTNLNSGNYALSVRSQNPDARYTYSTFHLTILPYWYEQVWFKCLLGGLAIGAFLLFFRLRYNYQVKRAQLLQQMVDERTGQLSESNKVKELMISAILHDLRSPLRFLHILARRMYNKHKTSEDKELSNLLSQFDNATNEIYDFTQGFFVFTNMQKEGFVIHRQDVVLREIVSEIISLCEVGAHIQKNTFNNLVPSSITLNTDASLLNLVLRNLADNANKYTCGGFITIEAVTDEFTTRIIITDAGDTMDRELVTRILDKSYNPSQHGMGWGYKIIIEILARLQGTLNIVPGDDRGNIITITFENNS
ncbi:ligand-binding sensor domain-containing protein [Niastella koreensis]|uniref:ligand-binding sensor domain-containing protein n=1 Tax=Niastella koreensis TaxID=354356 RepID=UPI0013FD4746|nr:two-component regulator propeller domain-containing protein [Niastella koreensis]